MGKEQLGNVFNTIDLLIQQVVLILMADLKSDTNLKSIKYDYKGSKLDIDKWNNLCKKYMKSFDKVQGNIYSIYIDNPNSETKKNIVYIGSSNKTNTRLKEHLLINPSIDKKENYSDTDFNSKQIKGTRSKLREVRKYIIEDMHGHGMIYYKAVNVPKSIRTAVEDRLISLLEVDKLGWNYRINN